MGSRENIVAGVFSGSAGRKAFLEKRAESELAIREGLEALRLRRKAVRHAAESSLPGTFEMLYQSNDGRLYLFQTEDGHISAVDSSRMA